MTTNVAQKEKRVFTGVVVSDKMDKTVVVETKRTFVEENLSKILRTSKKYKVHDEQEQAKVGDLVEFVEGRPASKTKYMYLKKVVKAAAALE